MMTFFNSFTTASNQLTFIQKGYAAVACLMAIFLTGTVTQLYAPENTGILLASMGASAVLLFAAPSSTMAKPWPFAAGQMISALVGIYVAHYEADFVRASALAVGLSVLLMLLLRCLHPPGAATALASIHNTVNVDLPDFSFLLMPVGVNVVIMLIITLLVNRLILPCLQFAKTPIPAHLTNQNDQQGHLLGINTGDIEQVIQRFDKFLDIDLDDLCQLLTQLQLLLFHKNTDIKTCGDIMQRNIITVEYATEVEWAWTLMHEHHLKVLPVLDKSKRVIGIVTHYDFLKHVQLTPYQSFQEKWLWFIKPSLDITTQKPEVMGHIMTRKVKTLSTDAHIAELVPLVVNEGHHHVPIVDDEERFVGLVFQSNLLTALFNQQVFVDSTKSIPEQGSVIE
ncbi:MAG: HPP family protein [Methylococcales bacterium]